LNGAPYRFTGIDNPSLTTDYNINYGCGETYGPTDVTNFFASLRPNSMVRVWAFQEIAYSKTTGSQDFQILDRVVNDAAQSGQKLVMTLADQWGTGCGEFYKTESWYGGGYKQLLTDGTSEGNLTTKLSYQGWVQAIVSRYANSPGVGMWEPVNEPYPSVSNGGACSSTAASTLRSFFDSVGGMIHSIDPNHLVSSGLQGSGQCGSAGTEYQTLHQSPGIDVATVHDYYAPSATMGGDQWNGIQVRVNQMAADNKPLFLEECGIDASDTTPGELTLSQRASDFQAKMNAQFGAGMVGYVPWEYSQTVSGTNYHIATGDPTLTLLHNYSL
jgi:endo-1,4-beta-mannosidase